MVLAISSVTGKSQDAQAHYINVNDFNVMVANNEVEISWTTEKSVATNYFEVEKSTDGEEFNTVSVVMGPDPTKTGCDCYSCFDKINAKTKTVYYRVKHIDTKGAVELSGIKAITLK